MLKSILFTIAIVIVSNIAEYIFVLIFIIGMKIDTSYFTSNIAGYRIVNLSVTLLYYLLLIMKPVRWLVQKSLNFFSESYKIETVILLLLSMFLIAGLTYPIIMTSSVREKITYSLVFIAFVYFIGNFFYQRSKNGELKKAYDYLLEYVKEYEKALDEKSKAQHEYKNQLSVIRGMANKNNKKLHKYIDDMLEIEENKESRILNNLKPLPTGGLKGLIYYKTASMIKKSMEVHVNVDSTLENEEYWNLCEKNLHSISTIVGVYLDNAIEAAENAEKKFVIIDIDVEEGNIIFSFSNTYEGHIEVGKMDKQGYSTKGKKRGYGLSLVQDILNKNTYLSQEREMNGIFYVQKLIIQNKK
jgi:two-component system sensor histidine kinase AgrC